MMFRLSCLLAVAGLSLGCPEPPTEICGNDLDDDDSGAADCDDGACSDLPECQPAVGCPVDVNFPTRDASTAVDVTVDTPTTGRLCPARDDDGYRISVANPGSVIVVTLSMASNIITNVNPGYSIAKDNGDGTATPTGIIASDPNTSQGHITNFTAAHRVEEAGNYIVIISDVEGLDNGFDNGNDYTLNVSVVADPDLNEPNNQPNEAKAIAVGTTTGVIATSGDDDWYAITVGADAQIVDVEIDTPADSGIEHIATLYAADGITELQVASVVDEDGDGVAEARLRKPASASLDATVLLKIEDGGDDGDLDSELDPVVAAYTLNVQVLADPDGNEGAGGNEEIATATPVSGGQTVNASLATFADQDSYRIAAPGGTSTSNPGVLIVEVAFDGTLDADFEPQIQILTSDPEDSTPPDCSGACALCIDGNTCAEPRLQRFIETSPFKTAYPLRNTRPLIVLVNEFNDDGVQLTGGYTITFTIVDDTDPGEVGDDFLIPNLESAGFGNGGELGQQREESKARARQVTLGYQPVCDEAAPSGAGCLDLVDVAFPIPGGFGFDPKTVLCSDAPPVTRSVTGRLTYEGDRDYFMMPDFPQRGYFGVEVAYTVGSATPVELAVFVHSNGGSRLAGSTLEADETGSCTEQQGGQNACAPGSVCVDERCWTDGASNPGRTVRFGDSDGGGDDECVVAGPDGFERPVYIEVVDNGINDFDLDMTYTLNITVTCGCPSVCDNGQDFCQDGP